MLSAEFYEYPKKVFKLKGKVGWIRKYTVHVVNGQNLWYYQWYGFNSTRLHIHESQVPKELLLTQLLME